MVRNAIILAAGKSDRFAPFTYEKPKGLFTVRGEVLIERQIEQLIEAGTSLIYVVVGYMKEKFFYLEQKYPGDVRLIVNDQFGKKGLDLDENGYCQIKNGMDKECFGANIQTILSDGFFLDYTIDEYFRQFLQEQWKILKGLFEKKELSKEEQDEVKQIAEIVPHIGDSFIRQAFGQMTNRILKAGR